MIVVSLLSYDLCHSFSLKLSYLKKLPAKSTIIKKINMDSALLLQLRNELVESSHFFNDNPIFLVAGTIICSYFCIWIFGHISRQQSHQEALQTMVNKRFARDEVVHRALNTKAKNTKRFVDVTELISEYRSGSRTCVDALLQLAHASHDLGLQPLCATTEEFYDEALANAEEVDKKRRQGKLVVGEGELGPLAGVPISIKDNYHMKGADSTIGIACRCFKPKEEDGLLVAQLRGAGALPYVKSNIPPLLLMPESNNMLWGTCRNPWDLSRTPGGSSGGEAALVASGCSLWGLGGDIGGSIRIPATYCGVVGFKPSYHRVSKQGSAVNRVGDRTGQQIIIASAGPIARSVRDCALMMEILTHDLPAHDFSAPPLPWNKDVVEHGLMATSSGGDSGSVASISPIPSPGAPKRRTRQAKEADMVALKEVMARPPTGAMLPKRQRVAVMTTDGWCDPVPAVKRAVQEAADALRNRGYEVVPFQNPICSTRMLQVYLSLMSADGNWHLLTQAMEGEALSESYNTLKKYTDFPTALRPPVRWLLQNVLGEKRRAAMFGLVPNGGSSVRDYWGAIADMKDMEKAYHKYFRDAGLDAVLMPTLPMTAPQHGAAPELIPMLTYTFLANLLHWPAGVVPVTVVRPDEQVYDISALPVFQQDGLAKLVQKCTEGSAGCPVGVQVMTPMWQDENCLHIMGDIEREIKFTAKPGVCADTI